LPDTAILHADHEVQSELYLMPKMKTHKGVAKRVKITATGKVMFRRSGRRHLLSSKSAKRRRALRRVREASPPDAARVKRLLGK